MAKVVTPAEFAKTSGINRGTVLRWCKEALAGGKAWCWKDKRGRWQLDQAKAKRAIARRGGNAPAAAKVRRAAKRSKAPPKPRSRKPPPEIPKAPAPASATSAVDEAAILEEQIGHFRKLLQSVTTKLTKNPTCPDLARMLKDSSVEQRQLMKRLREVREADESTIDRDVANQRLIAVALSQRAEWDNLSKVLPARMIQALSAQGLEPTDVELATRALTVRTDEEVDKILNRIVDFVESELT